MTLKLLAAWTLFAGAVCFLIGSGINLWLTYHPSP